MAEHRLSGLTAPSLTDIEDLAALAFEGLPEDFRALCGNVVIKVTEFPAEAFQGGPRQLLFCRAA